MITFNDYKVKVMSHETMTLKIKTDHVLHGIPSGGTVKVEVDKEGIPFDKNWRRRLKDSKLDGCVEVIKKSSNKKESK